MKEQQLALKFRVKFASEKRKGVTGPRFKPSRNPDGSWNVRRNSRITRINPDLAPARRTERELDGPKVYIIRLAGTDLFKIGYTSRPIDYRLNDLQHFCPLPLELVTWKHGSQLDETRLHHYLRFYNTSREWFKLPNPIVFWLLKHFKQITPIEYKLQRALKKHLNVNPSLSEFAVSTQRFRAKLSQKPTKRQQAA